MTGLKQFSRIQTTALHLDAFDPIEQFPTCGGMDVFIGVVRNQHAGKAVLALQYTAYTPIAEKMMRQIEQEIQRKYSLDYVRVIHRIGTLGIGEKALIALAYAAHRREAFAACEELVERVKHEVPIWKQEYYLDGSSAYVEGCCIRDMSDSKNFREIPSLLDVLDQFEQRQDKEHSSSTCLNLNKR